MRSSWTRRCQGDFLLDSLLAAHKVKRCLALWPLTMSNIVVWGCGCPALACGGRLPVLPHLAFPPSQQTPLPARAVLRSGATRSEMHPQGDTIPAADASAEGFPSDGGKGFDFA